MSATDETQGGHAGAAAPVGAASAAPISDSGGLVIGGAQGHPPGSSGDSSAAAATADLRQRLSINIDITLRKLIVASVVFLFAVATTVLGTVYGVGNLVLSEVDARILLTGQNAVERLAEQANNLLQLRQSFDNGTDKITDRLLALQESNNNALERAADRFDGSIERLERILTANMDQRDKRLDEKIDGLGRQLEAGFGRMESQIDDVRDEIADTIIPQGGGEPLVATDELPAPRPARSYNEFGIGSKYSIRRDAGFKPENGDEEPDARDLGAIEPAADTPWPPGDIDNRSLAIDGTTTSPMFGAATRMAPNETED